MIHWLDGNNMVMTLLIYKSQIGACCLARQLVSAGTVIKVFFTNGLWEVYGSTDCQITSSRSTRVLLFAQIYYFVQSMGRCTIPSGICLRFIYLFFLPRRLRSFCKYWQPYFLSHTAHEVIYKGKIVLICLQACSLLVLIKCHVEMWHARCIISTWNPQYLCVYLPRLLFPPSSHVYCEMFFVLG